MSLVLNQTEYEKYKNALANSLEKKDFRVMYQPIVNTAAKGIGLEMLMRWKYEQKWVPPLIFVPIIEQSGLIAKFNRILVNQLVRDYKQLKEKMPHLTFFSMNLSPYTFGEGEEQGFMDYLKEQLQKHEMSPNEICIEITESTTLKKSAFPFLEYYKNEGFLVAIDDFGAGYASYDYLSKESFNILKIDKTLIREFTKSERKTMIVDSILQLARKLSIRVVAEGVETKAEYDLLNKMGVQDIQGYYLSKPMFIEDFSTPKLKK